ncbi:hypothetical protein DTO027B5_1008 [Paecilomyces variotii]|nr:hypothetical protein DTO169C6_8480 [Paecilomyces variotii]KAJ9246355.1 hypothetical protein DTO207G8_9035 [Paecilomyces variotii]KAJ9321021.1 hypothetical protein DTO027B3_7970 [Paecilomyces variotii]KAJ9337210.1 hypothetical protein DTO027B5_1008 [Paecilomyces variotii]
MTMDSRFEPIYISTAYKESSDIVGSVLSLSLFAIRFEASSQVDEYSIKNYKPNQKGTWTPEQSGLSVQRHHTIVDQPDLDASILGPCVLARF